MSAAELVRCPVCHGTGKQIITEGYEWLRTWPGHSAYDPQTDTMTCRNCGGQTMSQHATGRTRQREDGTPCVHEFVGVSRGRCYTVCTCKHCDESYDIDSGD